ncbi:uncharacterized protein TrAFT101_010661 [Trichoderma asperellum]|uniref:uncharacterized protein n=1 Tax=Trichoderma asperellum TaxID=101201 RepID=UPI00332D5A7F|nr:hypothetical protein TrAFT101_010661 [Trichoderma asperellum]
MAERSKADDAEKGGTVVRVGKWVLCSYWVYVESAACVPSTHACGCSPTMLRNFSQ